MTANIFYKVCGQCMAQVPITANQCACGYSFEERTDSRTQEFARQIEDERAYETYLEARLQQALDRLHAVRGESVGDKWTHEQDKNVQVALQTLKAARDALNAQRRKTAETEEEAKRFRALRVSLSSPARNPRRPTLEPDAPTKIRIPTSKTPRASAPPTRAATASGERARTMPPVEGFKAADMELSAPRLVRAPAPRPIADPTHGSGAPRDRRQTATPTDRFRLVQVNLAQRLFPAAVEPEHHCPHCTATVPADAARCGCGYELRSESTIPALVWPADEPAPAEINRPRR